MNHHPSVCKRFARVGAIVGAGLLSAALSTVSIPARAALTMPTTPLATGTALPPNIFVLVDDSGSMGWNFMPGASASQFENSVSGPTTNIKYLSAAINGLAYDPTVTYSPGLQYDQSSWQSMTDLTAVKDDGYVSTQTTSIIGQYSQYQSCPRRGSCTTVTVTGWPTDDNSNWSSSSELYPMFYVLSSSSAAKTSSANYILYEFRLDSSGALEARRSTLNSSGAISASATAYSASTVLYWPEGSTASTATVSRTVAQEAANYANWYTYYRTRILMARTSLSRAFGELGQNYRVGFDTIWQRNTYDIPVDTNSGLFSGTNRQDWYSQMLSIYANGGTPLRTALNRVGQYFKDTSASGPYGPESGTAQIACRQNFTILTTDGYWNDSYSSSSQKNAVNVDGTQYSNTSGATLGYKAQSPFTDSASSMTTLADIAAYYWKTDLRTDLANTVPADDPTAANLADYTKDPAFWQHMVTFGISIGANGTLDSTLSPSSVTWPTPSSDSATGIDDLWHATVVSRGTFITAKSSTAFYSSLVAALNRINQRNGESSNVTANSTSLQTDTRVYQAIYKTSTWTGELRAFSIDSTTYALTQVWAAASQIPAAASRNIYFLSGSDTKAFTWANLSSSQQTALGSSDIVNYLRGDQSKELQNGGSFRNRSTRLGDIVDSSPLYDATTNTLYVAANDGFLHAFNASTGVERFAIVPSQLFSQLSVLSTASYTHQYFFDGDIYIKSVPNTVLGKTAAATTSGNSQLLVASLGRGGNGLIAVDVTDTSAPSILWEFTDTDLGLPIGAPLISKSNDSSNPWIVLTGNGVNSTNDKAFLFAVNAVTGTLVKKIDTTVGSSNGLINVRGWDTESNGTVDTVYGGDLKGNLWKFDLSASSGSSWSLVSTPLFQAKDPSGTAQPITGGIRIGISTATSTYGKRFVFFGTGSYLTASDSNNLNTQTLYGIIDQGSAVTSRSSLKQRTIDSVTTLTVNDVTYNVRTFSTATSSDMAGKSGWYLDLLTPPLPPGTQEGERIIATPQLLSSKVLLVPSVIPLSDPCSPGGSGWLNVLDPYSGGSVSTEFFTGFGTVGSVGTVGMPGSSAVFDTGDGGVELVTGKSNASMNTNAGKTGQNSGRISWRELLNQ
jgi:type IV pilus assembly protein PilY1